MSADISSVAKKDSIRAQLETTRSSYRALVSPLSTQVRKQEGAGSRRTMGDGRRFG